MFSSQVAKVAALAQARNQGKADSRARSLARRLPLMKRPTYSAAEVASTKRTNTGLQPLLPSATTASTDYERTLDWTIESGRWIT